MVKIDRFRTPILTPADTARHLAMPASTLYYWLSETTDGAEPLVHRVVPEKRGAPSVPFVAIVEAYVLRSLRELHFTKERIRHVASRVRRDFDTPYGLAARRIATDGLDIFVDYAPGEMVRSGDGQLAFREILEEYLKYISWEKGDEFPTRLTLRRYPDIAPVIIDPRFGWGAPVLAVSKAPVDAIVGLWRAGETMESVAEEYGMTRDAVEAICRAA
ncbi:MAG TPA: DUF433 domain-containing protein [Pseudonocardiaceae bacterium]